MKRSHFTTTIIHSLIWLLLYSIPLFLLASTDSIPWTEHLKGTAHFALLILLFYLMSNVLAPLFLIRRRVRSFFLWATLSLACFLCLESQFFHPPALPPPIYETVKPMPHEVERYTSIQPFRLFHHLSLYVLIMVLASAVSLAQHKQKQKIQQQKKEIDKLRKELAFLQNQISPHFFFNNLNTIYALMDKNPEQAKENVYELSRLMHYVLYLSGREMVPLNQELDFMNHYIKLMKSRLHPQVRLINDIPVHLEGGCLPPMLLISFIENAFKYGNFPEKDAFIEIKLGKKEQNLYFSCLNRVSSQLMPSTIKDDFDEKISLKNTYRRLHLIYDRRFDLQLNTENQVFSVNLEIPFNLTENLSMCCH